MYIPDYVFDGVPDLGETKEVAPGIFWVRMPLPFALNHINLWLLKDGEGWTIVDTGYNSDEIKKTWLEIVANKMEGRPVKRLVVTHFHPDHFGLGGWFLDQFDIPLWIPTAEWMQARMLCLETPENLSDSYHKFYHSAGFDQKMMSFVDSRTGRYAATVSTIPLVFNRLSEGRGIKIDGKTWIMIKGEGHCPEHACLYCEELNVLISGDQILPKISPNVSVWPQEPNGDPLDLFLNSFERFRHLPEDVLVLPSHNAPFRGLHARLDDLAAHHRDRLEETMEACKDGATGVDTLRTLFKRQLDNHQLFFAIGESIAHLNHLMHQGLLDRTVDTNGVYIYTKA